MSRYIILHEDKGLAFGNDHACGEYLQIWARPTIKKERELQDKFGAEDEEILVDKDTLFDKGFDRDEMIRLIEIHGFHLNELAEIKAKEESEIGFIFRERNRRG